MNTHKRNDVADLIRQRQTAGCSGIGRPTAVARTGPSYLIGSPLQFHHAIDRFPRERRGPRTVLVDAVPMLSLIHI